MMKLLSFIPLLGLVAATSLRNQAPGAQKAPKKSARGSNALQKLIHAMQSPEFLSDKEKCAAMVAGTMKELEDSYTDVQVPPFLSYVCESYRVYEDMGGVETCTTVFFKLSEQQTKTNEHVMYLAVSEEKKEEKKDEKEAETAEDFKRTETK
eukprot:gnl/MRDRNA2_/MRDRNA2_96739_c0_seq1.p1 gnl/MRDRNA2_/MRDRNA2_96739_c0~~gnl/MRDRNA2_/MRDRNA2_96739_c0_seq1.p1  ORF type:complete len:152 (-),score=35.62 gnl/MRDRNA2_/MRDRNA2_96739_c0_seq1:306-761(-)